MANAYAFCCNNERQTPQMFKFKNFQTIKLYPIHKTASDANFVCVCAIHFGRQKTFSTIKQFSCYIYNVKCICQFLC